MAPLFFLEEKLLILISSFLKHFNCKYMYLFFSKKIEETFEEVWKGYLEGPIISERGSETCKRPGGLNRGNMTACTCRMMNNVERVAQWHRCTVGHPLLKSSTVPDNSMVASTPTH